MHRSRKSIRGFTLIELLVAMTLSLLIGIAAYTLLHSVIKTNEAEKRVSSRLVHAQKAIWIISGDLLQMDPSSLVAHGKGDRVSFVRRGWPNPLGLPRSDLLQVAYAVEGGRLKRYYGEFTHDLSQKLVQQTLLEDVSGLSVRISSALTAEVLLTVPPYGEVRRVVEITRP